MVKVFITGIVCICRKEGSVITDIFGLEAVTTLRCRCGQEMKKHNETTLVNLIYPDCSGQGPIFCYYWKKIPFPKGFILSL